MHRDLKPANVVVTADGHVKLLDFGLAKKLSPAELGDATVPPNTVDSAGTIVGTLQYMAPETLRGEPADARTDIWAFGAVLAEMLAGSPPFHGRTAYELSSAILREMPAPLPPRVPVSLQSVRSAALRRNASSATSGPPKSARPSKRFTRTLRTLRLPPLSRSSARNLRRRRCGMPTSRAACWCSQPASPRLRSSIRGMSRSRCATSRSRIFPTP